MKRISWLATIVSLAVLTALVSSAWGQGTPAQINEPHGGQPFGAYQADNIDNIGFTNGAVDVSIPLFSRSGRGLTHQKYWTYTSKAWFQSSPPPCDPTVLQCPPPLPTMWMYADHTVGFGGIQQYRSLGCLGGHIHSEWTNYTYVDQLGTSHVFDAVTPVEIPAPNCIHLKLVGYSLDNSGMRFDSTTGIITFKDGTTAQATTLFKDANGNSITVAGAPSTGEIDTLGRNVQHLTGTLPDGAQYEDWITQDSLGNPQRARIEWASVPVCTNFQQGETIENCSSSGGGIRAARKIDLPNGLAYQFTYDSGTTPGHYGELLRIDLPAGGYIRYEYAPISSALSIYKPIRAVTKRAVSADGTAANEKAWTYNYQLQTPDISHNTTLVTDPDGNQTAHVITNTLFDVGSPVPLETETRFYQGSTSLLRTVRTEYSTLVINVGDADDNSVTARTLGRPFRVTTTLDNGLTNKVETDYDSLPDANGVISFSRSNVTERREYDYGGSLLRRTTYTYLHNANSDYAAANIVDKVLNTTVYDGANNIVAQTQNVYDGASLTNTNASGNCQFPSGAPNHDYCAFGTANLIRGNLTSVKAWRNTDNTWLTTNISYDDLGNAISSTDPAGHPTTFSYSDRWSGASCITPGVNTYAFVSQITNAVNFRTQTSYYSCPGLIQSKRDENDIVAGRQGTTFTYDGMNRLLIAQYADGGQTGFDYHGDTLPISVTKTQLATPNPSIISSVIYDGLGRVKTTSLDSDPLGADLVDTTYDNLGRQATVSNPHRASTGQTDGTTTYQYDALGRVTQVAAPDGTFPTVGSTCLANNLCNQYSGNVATVTDQAGKQRRSISDALGRLIEVDEPGGPDPGAQATASVTISGAFNSTWVAAGTPHLAATGTALASVTMADGSSHNFYFDTNQHLCQLWGSTSSGWATQDLTEQTEAALPMSGSSLSAVFQSPTIHVFYQGANQHIYDMEWTGSVWQNLDMTLLTGATAASGAKLSTLVGGPNSPMTFYEGTNQHFYLVYWAASANVWSNADLSGVPGATTLMATNSSVSSAAFGGGLYGFYHGTNQHLITIYWSGSAWLSADLTALSGGVLATAGSALTSISTVGGTPLMNFYEGPSQHIYGIYWSSGANAWQSLDFTSFTGATHVAAVLTALSNNPAGPQAYYLGNNQHLDDINWNGSAWVNSDLTALSGSTVVPASGSSLSSHGTSGGNTSNIFFEGTNQHIYHTYYKPSAPGWFNEDLLAIASNFVIDFGTVSLVIPNGTSNFTATVCYGVSTNPVCAGKPINASSSDIANALAGVLNGTGSPVNAVATGTALNLTWRTVGSVTTTVASMTSGSDNPGLFPSGSFTSTSASFSGGAPSSSQSLTHPFVTLYKYDTLGSLYCVEQHGDATTGTGCPATPPGPTDPPVQPDPNNPWRRRLFAYNSLSRLRWTSNPESGVISYAYDADGNLLQKTSPLPNQTGSATQTISYCYDELHRVTGKAYSAQTCQGTQLPPGTAVVSYIYDSGANAKGHLTSMTDQAGTVTYGYDMMGRQPTVTRSIAGISKSIGYAYNLDGSMKTLTYPSGRIITYTPDSAGRLVSVVDGNGTSYVTSASYNPDGSLKGLLNGSTPALNQSFQYTPRLQLCRITTLTSGTLPTSCTDSQHIGNVMDRGYNLNYGAGDNGNVVSITNYRDTNRSQTFTFDALNRLTSGWSSANIGTYSWGENYSIDAWGNLQISPMGGKAHGGTFQLSGNAQNRPTGLAFDSAGNLMSYLSSTYTYDQENRLSSTAGMSYTYDGNGERVLKAATSTGMTVKRYWSLGGNTLAEADGSGSITSEYVYFGGKLVARIDLPSNTVHYYLSDHLGSTSIIASTAGAIEEESDYFAFGTEVVVTGPGVNELKFTGKRRDTESNIDYFGARYLSFLLGRFTSPDDGSDQSSYDPQSWNLYNYVRNNPISNTDPDGHDCVVQTRTSAHTETISVSPGDCSKVNVGDGQSKTYVPGTVTSVSAGSDGRSIDIGYKPYDGSASTSVFTAGSAPTPDRPGLAYGYNSAAYAQIGSGQAFIGEFAKQAVIAGVTGGVLGAVLKGAAVTATAAEMIAGPFGSVSRAALEMAASGGGETVTVVTRLTQAPLAGRALSVAVGDGAEALASAARAGGQTFTAQVPKVFINLCLKSGLARESITSMGGTVAREIRFAPAVTEFIVRFFR